MEQDLKMRTNHGKGGKTMRATGTVRRIDDLGRVVIPKTIRKEFNINDGDPLEMFTLCDETGEYICFKKYVHGENSIK